MEDRLNIVLQRCVEHGIVKYLVAKNKRLLSGSRPNDQKVISTIVKPVSVSDMKDSFLLFAVGIVLSAITFIIEKIYFWNSYHTNRMRFKLQ